MTKPGKNLALPFAADVPMTPARCGALAMSNAIVGIIAPPEAGFTAGLTRHQELS